MSIPVSRLDLNLFRVMDAVYEHGGISGAARHLHLSQPAVSHALARLRRMWGDPLFVRQGNRMVPTELSRRVIGQVQGHLRGLQSCIEQAATFDPQTLDMSLRLGLRDVLEGITLPPLMRHLSVAAPGVVLSSQRLLRDSLERALVDGEVDLALERQMRVGPRIRGERMASESLSVLMRRGHPITAGGLNVSNYFEAKHILVSIKPDQVDPLHSVWTALGLGPRQVVLRCQHYFAASQVVADSDALLTLPSTYARQLAQVLPVEVQAMPVSVPPLAIWMYWHADRDTDPVHRWLRDLVGQGAREAMNSVHDL